MSMKSRSFIPRALVVSGILFGVFLISPASHAGNAMTLMPEQDRDAPEGSQIPDWRVYETEEKVRDYKEKMKQTTPVQRQEELRQDELLKPEAEQP